MFERGDRRGVPPQFADKILIVLDAVEDAEHIKVLEVPGFGLHELKGDRAGIWAITITRNWRIIFAWNEEEGNAYYVDYEDYH